jgi:ketosteroid isomerase-like protein
MPTRREVSEAEIRRQVDKIVEGIRTRDLEGLKRLYAADVVSFDVEPPLQHVGVEVATKGMWVRATFCFQKIDGNWLIAHDQASVPLDIVSGKGVTNLEP